MDKGRSHLQQMQENVEEVKVIMLDNLNKAEERTGKLGELESRADKLEEIGKTFSKTTTKVKNQKKWEFMKMRLIVAAIVIIVLGVIIIGIIISVSGGDTENSSIKSSSHEEKIPESTTPSGEKHI